jgi:5-(carboxyamino)imidazole ribonucleotide mutase
MLAAFSPLPVLGVPVESHALKGQDSLLSIVQMPAGVPVATLAIGKAGAVNAALLSASILGHEFPEYHAALKTFRDEQTQTVLDNPDPRG